MAKDKGPNGPGPTFEELARARARMYESIGRMRGEISAIAGDGSSPEPSSDAAPGTAPDAPPAAVRAEIDALRRAMKATEDALQASEEARGNLLEEKVRLRNDAEQARAERDAARRDRDADRAKLERAKALTREALDKADAERAGVERSLVEAQASLAGAAERIRSREDELRRLKSELAWAQSDVLEKAGDAAKTIRGLHGELRDRDARLAGLERQSEELVALKSRSAAQQQENEVLAADLDRVRAELERVKGAVERDEALAREALEKAAAERAGVERELVEATAALAEAAERSRSREEELRRLKSELAWAQSDVLEKAGDAAKAIKGLHGELRDRDAQLERQSEELVEHKSRAALQQQEKEALAADLGRSRAEAELVKGALEKDEARIDSLQHERDKLALLREASRRRLETFEAENRALRDELKKTADNLTEVKKILSVLEEAKP